MTAGTHNITINRGGYFGQTFTLTETSTGEPIDLTDREPFHADVRFASAGRLVLEFTVTVADDPATGVITLTATPEQTAEITTGTAYWGLIDGVGNLYAEGTATIKGMIPEL